MTFTTLTFLVFLFAVFAAYWVLPRRGQNVLLVLASYFFYGWWDWRFCFLMLASSLLDYFAGLGLEYWTQPARRKAVLAVALTGNLTMLGFFKYFNFFTENLTAMTQALGWHLDVPTVRVVLPVGISFYTFQTMSYSIDIYRRQLRACRPLPEYMAYVSFFPQLVAGPIERAAHMLPQFLNERRFEYAAAADGCRRMLWGFFKKMVVADNLAPVVDRVFSNPTSFEGTELMVASVFFGIQIYCDFSAYSDIAAGAARLFGFELMKNFACPYFAQSMRDFWRRWHIALSTWFRDYVYLPLGGARVSRGRQAANVMATFVLSGIWHGAAWNYVCWGAWHGLASLPEILHHKPATPAQAPRAWVQAAKTAAVLAVVGIGWILFRARNLSEALTILARALPTVFQPGHWPEMLVFATETSIGYSIFTLLPGLIVMEWVQRQRVHPLEIQAWPGWLRWAVYFSMTALILIYGTYNQSAFIYFQF